MRKISLLLTLILISAYVFAKPILPSEASLIASNFFQTEGFRYEQNKNLLKKVGKISTDVDKEWMPYYVFNRESGNGFVIVSGDTRIKRILGYSDSGCFDFNNLPPQLAELLCEYAEQIEALPSSMTTDPSWNIREDNNERKEVLLKTANWGQGYPYNMYAPEIDGEKCPSGCVATAMSIIMKYNNWPDKGRGQHKWMTNGAYSEYNFENTAFDYSLMLDTYEPGRFDDSQAEEVAKIMKAAAAGVNMQYNLEGSGAMTQVVGHYMHEFFKYSPKSQYISTANFEDTEWLDIIREQIDSNHPIIMNGYNMDVGGHAFVCDGYTSDNMLHINWGWDGSENGYFDPFILGGFSEGIGIVINLFNDQNRNEYARCWIDYGYLWATSGVGSGFNVSVERIEKDVPFSAVVGQFTFPNDFKGTVCLALVDENENIIEVNDEVRHSFVPNDDWDHIGYTWVGYGTLLFKDVVFKSEINPSMRLQAVAREDGGDWKIILGTIEAPSSKKTYGNPPYLSNIKWDIHDPYNLTEVIYINDNENSVMMGDDCPFEVKIYGGVAYVLIDGIYRTNGSDFTPCSFNFTTTKDNYHVEIFANRYEDLLTRKIILDKAGELSSKILESEWALIYDLTVEGPMNADDYKFISCYLFSLKHLDVSNTTVEESAYNRKNYLPEFTGLKMIQDAIGGSVWGLESIRLPKDLQGFEQHSMPTAGIEFLEIPASVGSYEWNSVSGELDFLKVNNPIPVDILDESGALDLVYDGSPRNNTVLFVPVGSKEAYLESPSWRGYKDIRETNLDFLGKYAFSDSVRYLILADKAVVSGFYTASDCRDNYFVVPERIVYEGNEYPVCGHCRELQTNYLYLDNVTDFEFNTGSTRIIAAVTPHLTGNYSGGKPTDFMQLLIPGATSDHYEKSGCHINEMWSYRIDKEHKLISITPNCCNILSVEIDGKKAEPISGDIYALSDVDNLTVAVKFTTFYHDHQMVTQYSSEFNNHMQSVDLSIPVDHVMISDEYLELKVGDSVILTTVIYPENTTYRTVSWMSSDAGVASVDAEGKVMAVSDGTATITASCGSSSATCSVTVHADSIMGDADGNGIVDANDIVVMTNYYLELVDDINLNVSDINKDGVIDSQDAILTSIIYLNSDIE